MAIGDAFATQLDSVVRHVRRVSFRHGVPEARILELLHSAELSYAESGSASAFDAPSFLTRLERNLDVAGAQSWITRITMASGAEALFDRDFRFLAVSGAGRTLTSPDGKRSVLPEEFFLGSRYVDLLPARDSFLGDAFPGFDGLKGRGFFEGACLGVQIDLDMDLGFHVISCIMEVWAVDTLDRGILGHSLMHSHRTLRRLDRPGIKVNSVHYVWTRSH